MGGRLRGHDEKGRASLLMMADLRWAHGLAETGGAYAGGVCGLFVGIVRDRGRRSVSA